MDPAKRRVVKSKRIVPDVSIVALVDSAANGAKVLLMKDGKSTSALPPELAMLAGAKPKASQPIAAEATGVSEFVAVWDRIAGK